MFGKSTSSFINRVKRLAEKARPKGVVIVLDKASDHPDSVVLVNGQILKMVRSVHVDTAVGGYTRAVIEVLDPVVVTHDPEGIVVKSRPEKVQGGK